MSLKSKEYIAGFLCKRHAHVATVNFLSAHRNFGNFLIFLLKMLLRVCSYKEQFLELYSKT